ncbi:hypothetical protein VP1G_11327 [Cytospora mali]|uniref:Uncharacterized protein n=1 Tax=Cytospora mali TaxID=578113 RepID=A0A194VDW6_CYTMA|nr:hypothetical protein VP1G_11327 [Valsa mali var. pyri (nom. inval.)]
MKSSKSSSAEPVLGVRFPPAPDEESVSAATSSASISSYSSSSSTFFLEKRRPTELLHVTLLVLLLKVHITKGVDNQNLSILRNDALLRALRTTSSRRRRRGARSRGSGSSAGGSLAGRALGAVLGRLLLGLALLHAPHLAVRGHGPLLLGLRRRRRRCRVHGGRDGRDSQVVAPGGVARELDVALDELALALPAHVQGEVVGAAAEGEEDAEHDGAQARAVALVEVVGALPDGEAVGHEVVVAGAAGPLEDVGDDGQARLPGPRLLAVGLVDVILAGGWGDAQEVVEGHVGTLVGGELVAEAEDFAIWGEERIAISMRRRNDYEPTVRERVLVCFYGGYLPSFDQAAVRGVKRANRPRESTENLMIACRFQD